MKGRHGSAPHELWLGDDVRRRGSAPGENGGYDADRYEERPSSGASFTDMTSQDPTDSAESAPRWIRLSRSIPDYIWLGEFLGDAPNWSTDDVSTARWLLAKERQALDDAHPRDR